MSKDESLLSFGLYYRAFFLPTKRKAEMLWHCGKLSKQLSHLRELCT